MLNSYIPTNPGWGAAATVAKRRVAPTTKIPKPVPLGFTPAAQAAGAQYAGTVPPVGAPVSPFLTDPSVALSQAQAQQGNTDLDAWLKAQQDRANLDQQTGLARIAHNQGLDHMQIINNLAARGLLHSGDLGFREGESAYQFGNQQQDLRQAILDKLAGYTQQYLAQKQQLQAAVLQAMQNAYANAAANPPAGPLPAAGAPVVDPNAGGYAGGALYPTKTEDPRISPIFWFK